MGHHLFLRSSFCDRVFGLGPPTILTQFILRSSLRTWSSASQTVHLSALHVIKLKSKAVAGVQRLSPEGQREQLRNNLQEISGMQEDVCHRVSVVVTGLVYIRQKDIALVLKDLQLKRSCKISSTLVEKLAN